jgi:hypothetical protein
MSNFKSKKCVSKVLRNFAKGQDCTMRSDYCNLDPETVVLCHARMAGFNGTAMKPPDFLGYHGCSSCHANEHKVDPYDIHRAVAETQVRLLDAGLIVVKGA